LPAAALPTTAAAEVAVTAAAAAVTAATAVAFAAAVPAVTAAATVAFAAAAATHGQLLGRSTCSGDCRTFHFQQTLELPDCHVTVGRSLGLLDCLVSRFLVYQRFEIDKLVSQTLQEVMRRELVAQTDDLIDPAALLLPRRRNCCGLGNGSAGGPFACFGQTLQPATNQLSSAAAVCSHK
jgi:hypothetical protein